MNSSMRKTSISYTAHLKSFIFTFDLDGALTEIVGQTV